MPAPVLVLGPQRPEPNIRAALDAAGVSGSVGLITAGWRHDEAEIEPLVAHLNHPVVHLTLYAEMDRVFRENPEVFQAYRARQKRVRAYKEVYRISLRAASMAVSELFDRVEADPSVYGPDLGDAIGALRLVDERVLDRVDQIYGEHPDIAEPWTHPAVAEVRQRWLDDLDGGQALLIAGGHVAVLRNRLRFFGLDEVIAGLPERGVPVVAWSAGAMVLARRIVLFYDDPPEGHGMAEVLGRGIGLLPGVVWLPHARLRLDLQDRKRVAILSRRLRPEHAVALETGAALRWDGAMWHDSSDPESCFALGSDGGLVSDVAGAVNP